MHFKQVNLGCVNHTLPKQAEEAVRETCASGAVTVRAAYSHCGPKPDQYLDGSTQENASSVPWAALQSLFRNCRVHSASDAHVAFPLRQEVPSALPKQTLTTGPARLPRTAGGRAVSLASAHILSSNLLHPLHTSKAGQLQVLTVSFWLPHFTKPSSPARPVSGNLSSRDKAAFLVWRLMAWAAAGGRPATWGPGWWHRHTEQGPPGVLQEDSFWALCPTEQTAPFSVDVSRWLQARIHTYNPRAQHSILLKNRCEGKALTYVPHTSQQLDRGN